MPKFYCEYCGIYLTHSSPGGRKQHSLGRKHINAKVDYYQKLVREHFFQPPPFVNPGVPPQGGFPPIVPGAAVPSIPGVPPLGGNPQVPMYDAQPGVRMIPPAPPSHPPPPYVGKVGLGVPPNPPYGLR